MQPWINACSAGNGRRSTLRKLGQPCTLGCSQRNKQFPLPSMHPWHRAELSRHTCALDPSASFLTTPVQTQRTDGVSMTAQHLSISKSWRQTIPQFHKNYYMHGNRQWHALTLSLKNRHSWSSWWKDEVSCFIWAVYIGRSDLIAKVMWYLPYPLMPC